MSLSALCIKRPVLATVLSLVVILIGLVSFQRLTIREYPEIDEPTVSVTTTYRGASADIIETQITTIIEDSISGIEGIKTIKSVSREGQSEITVTFRLERDPDDSAAEVRDRVGRVRADLPDDIDEPVIAKVEANSDPIIWIAFSSDRHTTAQLTDYVDRFVIDQIKRIDGVADAIIFAERRYAMRIWLDAMSMAAHNITTQDVEDALERQNQEIPGGRVQSREREFTVRNESDLRTVAQFNDLIIRVDGDYLLRVRDVGRAVLGVEEDRQVARFNGIDAVAIGVVRQSVANPLQISTELRQLLPAIQGRVPDGMRIDLAYDSSVFIDASIDNVYTTLVEAAALVLAVILFFLRSARAVMVPMVTIPISLICTGFVMWVLGFSVNTLTLLSMVLAIGLVVDDAIVMLENIYRHIERGLHPIKAALLGAREIQFAIIATTVALVAVFVPVAFMAGRTGRLFVEFALTLTGAVIISSFVALTLSPMMCSRLLRRQETEPLLARPVKAFLDWLDRIYADSLRWSLKNRGVVILVALFAAAGNVVVFTSLPSELAPTEDRGVIFGILVGPEAATVDFTDAYMHRVEDIYREVPEMRQFFVASGFPIASDGFSVLLLKDWAERERHAAEIAGSIFPGFLDVAGTLAFPVLPPSLGASPVERPVNFVIMDSSSYRGLDRSLQAFLAEVSQNPNLLSVDTDLRVNTPQIRVGMSRDRIGTLGLDVATVGRTVETMLGGREVTKFKQNGEQYEVIVQAEEAERTSPDQLMRFFTRTPQGDLLPLSAIVDLTETVEPRDRNHFNRSRAVTVTANLAPGYSLGEALEYLNDVAARTLPPGATIGYDGQSLEFFESGASLYLTFALALVFIFLVLAAQFESFVDPAIIMLTVPLSMIGALLALQFTGNSLNVYSQIGLVTLVGLISKNGILITEFANQLQEAGKAKMEAIVEASILRLRPILMTAFSMILGTMPLAFSSGAGAESRHQIGWVIVGGLLVGTFFSIYVVPMAYSFIARDRQIRPTTDYTPFETEPGAGQLAE
jgi:multidrug efflux pump